MSKEDLEVKRSKYLRLKSLTEQNGWKDFMEILEEEYNERLDNIKAPKYVKSEIESRGVLNFIDSLMAKVNSELDFGKVAQEKYVKKFLTTQED